jgi:hypothetical protein
MATGRPLFTVAAVVAAFVLGSVAVTGATPQAQARISQARAGAAPSGDAVAVMGASLARIRRLLGATPPTQPSTTASLLRVQYHIEVVGKAQPLDIFKNFDLGRGTAVQYGGMTHDEFLRLTAPPWRKR